MKCPHCDVNLLMSERQGVEIDYCPECRGVWLDRGELDKIVERSHADLVGAPPAPAPPSPSPARSDDRYRDDDRRRDDRRDERPRYDSSYDKSPYDKKKKRKSFLEEIFDF